MSLSRRPKSALASAALGVALATVLAPPRPLRAADSSTHVLPPHLEPLFGESQQALAESGKGQALRSASIAILADQVRFSDPHSGVLLLVLTEAPAPPWFRPSDSRLPAHEVEALLRVLGQRLDRSPWRRPSTAPSSMRKAGHAADPWIDEPTRSLPFALTTAALVWAMFLGLLLAVARSRRDTSRPPHASALSSAEDQDRA